MPPSRAPSCAVSVLHLSPWDPVLVRGVMVVAAVAESPQPSFLELWGTDLCLSCFTLAVLSVHPGSISWAGVLRTILQVPLQQILVLFPCSFLPFSFAHISGRLNQKIKTVPLPEAPVPGIPSPPYALASYQPSWMFLDATQWLKWPSDTSVSCFCCYFCCFSCRCKSNSASYRSVCDPSPTRVVMVFHHLECATGNRAIRPFLCLWMSTSAMMSPCWKPSGWGMSLPVQWCSAQNWAHHTSRYTDSLLPFIIFPACSTALQRCDLSLPIYVASLISY